MPRISRAKPLLGIGIDIERVERFEKEMQSSSRILTRVFTARERAYCMTKVNPSMHFAGTYAAKEAAFKALSGLLSGKMGITDFEIFHDGGGAPRVKLTRPKIRGRTVDIKVSVSHTPETAVAVAFALIHE